jgi:hypothetical protein
MPYAYIYMYIYVYIYIYTHTHTHTHTYVLAEDGKPADVPFLDQVLTARTPKGIYIGSSKHVSMPMHIYTDNLHTYIHGQNVCVYLVYIMHVCMYVPTDVHMYDLHLTYMHTYIQL